MLDHILTFAPIPIKYDLQEITEVKVNAVHLGLSVRNDLYSIPLVNL